MGPSTSQRGESLVVYVMTMGPGAAVWERFGHNAILIRDTARDIEVAYNYGLFSFEQENFILRFIRGHMDYEMAPGDGRWMAQAYANENRSVWLQELNLTPAQRADLLDFLEWNALPENRTYRYNYYLDNCSTRVRDALDRVLGGRIRAETDTIASGSTFRSHTRALTGSDPLLYTGLMIGLGQPVDREISVWEEMFLPLMLRERLRDVTVLNADGMPEPLVVSEQVLYESTTPVSLEAPPSRWWVYLLIGLVVGGGILVTGTRWIRGESGGRAFAAMTSTWGVVAGLLSLVLVGLWVFTDHQTSYRNENILQLSPLLLMLPILIVGVMCGKGAALQPAARLAVLVAAGSVVGFLVQVLPGFSQVNGEVIALALPINLAIAVTLVRAVGGDNVGRNRAASARTGKQEIGAAA